MSRKCGRRPSWPVSTRRGCEILVFGSTREDGGRAARKNQNEFHRVAKTRKGEDAKREGATTILLFFSFRPFVFSRSKNRKPGGDLSVTWLKCYQLQPQSVGSCAVSREASRTRRGVPRPCRFGHLPFWQPWIFSDFHPPTSQFLPCQIGAFSRPYHVDELAMAP